MSMQGWIVPPPREPRKSRETLARERAARVKWIAAQGILRSDRIREALLKVPREDFIPRLYRDYAYREVPLPLPGEQATISCPHSYPLFYEPLGLEAGHRFLEIGLGSGYGAAVAREVVGPEGLVVAVEIDPVTFEFGARNLVRGGYDDIVLVRGDGGLGHPAKAPYDRIAITAAGPELPPPLVAQLKVGGQLIGPRAGPGGQPLVLVHKGPEGVEETVVCEVLYVPLRGAYGVVDSLG